MSSIRVAGLEVRSAACSSSRVNRKRRRARISNQDEGELEALTDLSIKLRELRAVELRAAREKRSRAAYLQGAEEDSRATLGRPLTPDELERVLRRYPADG